MNTTTAPAAQATPISGIEKALDAARKGWLVYPVGTDPALASDDPETVKRLWSSDPLAGVAFARLSAEGIKRQARLGEGRDVSINDLCGLTGMLDPIEQEQTLLVLKHCTDLPITTLRAQMRAIAGNIGSDDLELAQAVLQNIGPEHLVFADGFAWSWDPCGVWRKLNPIAVKQAIQAHFSQRKIPIKASRITAVADVLKTHVFRTDHQFNIGPKDAVNCRNGELELVDRAWRFVPHRREHYRTTQVPVVYSPETDAPLWDRFLADIFRDDTDRAEKVQALHQLIGYSLVSHANHEKFVMLIGSGANGKSVFLHVLTALLGAENVSGVQPCEFANRFQRAHLHMKLANIVTELKQGEVIADAALKAITSGETTTVEHKHAEPFDMSAFATCWFGTKHMPHTRDFSDALFRRATILTFNRTFAPHERDPYLKDKLVGELSAILTRSLMAYQRAVISGFTAPPSSELAKAKWRREADQVALFVEERCTADPLGSIPLGEIYRHFRNWAADSGVRAIVGKQAFGDRLERLGYQRHRSDGTKVQGLAVTSVI
ncbi:phage/plasmid primase, P4 family [Qipengyuania spongiae]|uniref:Phage/plasmid primase, P4 family n=1 Tax=Qipengyuania spongiae TaxID=2909673 RepID=A0ABY5SY70_9SPHN|nr:phage/plasmid primase, P4 family [Qipengyuania spongiae]UVI39110.1 phage/plasmid primase, P4 family [Qipengyuania spongiae]